MLFIFLCGLVACQTGDHKVAGLTSKSHSVHCQVTTLGKLSTPVCFCRQSGTSLAVVCWQVAKNYWNLGVFLQVTVDYVGDVFLDKCV